MIYGDVSREGTLSWLNAGTASIAPWRLNTAMILAFPGIILYGIALFSLEQKIKEETEQKRYRYLNAFGLTPWLALHLFYIMIISTYAWMSQNGMQAVALTVCEALFHQLSWLVIVSEGFMIPVFVYLAYLQFQGKTQYRRHTAYVNVLVIFMILKGITYLMGDTPFRLAFTNGLMSESMLIWFVFLYRQENALSEKPFTNTAQKYRDQYCHTDTGRR